MTGDTDVSVRFGGDTTQLNAAIGQARQTLASFAPQATTQAKASLDGLSASLDTVRTRSQESGSSWRENIATLADITTVLRGAAAAAENFADVMSRSAAIDLSAGLLIQRQAIQADADALGALRTGFQGVVSASDSFDASMQTVIENMAHGADGARSFLHDQEGLIGVLGRTIESGETTVNTYRLLSTNAERAAIDAIAAAGGLSAFEQAATAAGWSLKDFTAGYLAEIEKIPETTDEAAAAIQGMLGSIPNYSQSANSSLVAILQTISKNGQEAVENATKLKAALSDDSASGGVQLADMMTGLVDKLKDASTSAGSFKKELDDVNRASSYFASTLQPAAASAYFDTIINKLRTQSAEQKTLIDDQTRYYQSLGILGQAAMFIERSTLDLQREQNQEREKTIDLMTQQKSLADGIVAAQARESTYQTTLDKANPLNAQIADVSGKISVLQGKLDRTSGAGGYEPADVDALVKTIIGEAGNQSVQGQLAVGSVIMNRLANGNFGDSISDVVKAGNGSQFNTWLPLDKGGSPTNQANAPASDDSYVYQRTLTDLVLPLLQGKLTDPTDGALNFYNKAQTAPKNQFAMDNTTTIDDHTFGTAKNSPAPVAPMDADDITRTQQAVSKLQDQLKTLNDEKAGGSVIDQAALTSAQKQVDLGKDEVDTATEDLNAKQKSLADIQAAGGSTKAQEAATKSVADAEITLQEKVTQQLIAQIDLRLASTVKGSAQELALEKQKNDLKASLYAKDSAGYIDAQAANAAAQKRYDDQQTQDAISQEAIRLDAIKVRLQNEKELIQSNAQTGQITGIEATTQLIANQRAQDQAVADSYTKRAALASNNLTEQRRYLQQAQQAQIQSGADLVKLQQQYAAQVQQFWKGAFEGVSSSVSSSLIQMQEGTAKFRDLERSAVESVEGYFLQAGLKIVADWLATQAKNLTISVATQSGILGVVTGGEAAQTAATAAGTAARTGLAETASAIQVAQVATGVIKSILASAAATFAGIFGFLSPIMGPLAAGPAAAGEAVVAAKAALPGYAVGSWSLPHDMIAQVHAGEMIVPAAQTPWAQSLMGAAAGGAAGGGASMFHFHIDGSRKANEIVAEVKNNVRDVMRVLQDGSRRNLSMR